LEGVFFREAGMIPPLVTIDTIASTWVPGHLEGEQHPLSLSILLHLLPGVAIFLVLALAAVFTRQRNLPLELPGSLGILLVLGLFELGLLAYLGWKRNGRLSLSGIIHYRESTALWKYMLLVPLLCFWFWNASGFWNGYEANFATALGGLPDWFVRPFESANTGNYSRAALWWGNLLVVLSSGLVAPLAEELYFRGYLLPRIERLGVWAVVLNTVLFAFHHTWTLLVNPGRVLAWLPIVFVVWRTRNIRISLLVHLITNLVGVMGPALFVLGG
jgi:membrane protease YdiL (CAAX protease family)